eukprot:gene52721-65450_t
MLSILDQEEGRADRVLAEAMRDVTGSAADAVAAFMGSVHEHCAVVTARVSPVIARWLGFGAPRDDWWRDPAGIEAASAAAARLAAPAAGRRGAQQGHHGAGGPQEAVRTAMAHDRDRAHHQGDDDDDGDDRGEEGTPCCGPLLRLIARAEDGPAEAAWKRMFAPSALATAVMLGLSFAVTPRRATMYGAGAVAGVVVSAALLIYVI